MESKEILGMMSAYSSIYEKKEEPEMEEGEKEESEKDEGGKHKEGKHKKGKEEKGEKVTEKEDEDKEDEKKMKEEVELDEAGLPYGPVGRGFKKLPPGKKREAMIKRAGALRTQAMKDDGDGGKGSPRGKMGEINDALTNPRLREETDLFDYILEHLVAEGYADTNKAALAIMANMSEEWREDIIEDIRGAITYNPNTRIGKIKRRIKGSTPEKREARTRAYQGNRSDAAGRYGASQSNPYDDNRGDIPSLRGL